MTYGDEDRGAVRERAEAVLRRLAGEQAKLRDDQWRAIEALVVDKRRVLCVQRTGWGKSAVYFVATALLRDQPAGTAAGPTVIVSPLLALMRNQVEAAARAGIRARTINSANLDEWDEITEEIHRGGVDVLLISPERLNNPDFRHRPAQARGHHRAARRGRGSLRLRLGARLPAGLPAAAHVPRWATGTDAGSGHDGHGQQPGDG
jgi:superfamily II DNA helicase RecQ